MKKNKEEYRTLTFRLSKSLYEKCVNEAIERSVKENRIIKVSEIIRESIEKTINKIF